MGNAHPNIVPTPPLCADGHLIAVGNDGQFQRLCQVLTVEPEERFATNQDRLARRDELTSSFIQPPKTGREMICSMRLPRRRSGRAD